MESYLKIIDEVLREGDKKSNRTGIDTYSISGTMFKHDMSKGFPLLTTKKMFTRGIMAELEFFINGITDKNWLKEKNVHIWDEWCSPKKVPYGHDKVTQRKMAAERDLGPIYGFQWRHFGAEYNGHNKNYIGKGVDQFKNLVNKLKTNPSDRRMIVSAWNPGKINEMALPPCHYGFQVLVNEDTQKLDLLWNQRSVDTMLGLPFNITSYATLLHLLAKESGFKEGKLIGFLADTHIYENHIQGAKEQLKRTPYNLPQIITEKFINIFDWKHTDTKIEGYQSYPKINFEIAI